MESRRWIGLPIAAAVAVTVLVLTGCTSAGGGSIPPPADLPRETTQTSVYFSTGRSLFEEPRVVDATDVYKDTLDELIEATPETNEEAAIVQPQASIRSVSLKDGVLTIDWSREILTFEANRSEQLLALGAVLRTLGQFSEVEKVRFTVEGRTEGRLDGRDVRAFWGDVSLSGQPWSVLKDK
jgi:hypothetical protein